MKKLTPAALLIVVAIFAVTCSRQPTAPSPGGASAAVADVKPADAGAGNTPLSATIEFGRNTVGSPYPPVPPHDASAHAKDSLFPSQVVIGKGGKVTFKVPPGVHQVAIYKPGTEPEDINTAPATLTTLAAFAKCAGNPVVNAPLVITDPTNREAVYPIPCFAPGTAEHTFVNEAGRYLVICAFLPHFEGRMYGWVTVRE